MKYLSKIGSLCAIAIAMATLSSCKEDIDTSARYVFRNHTVLSYLEKHGDVYSTYVDLLHKVNVSPRSSSTVAQLLTARGHYTCFAPTNDAIQDYLDTLAVYEPELLSAPSWEAFNDSNKLDSIRKVIVYNSIIDSGDEPEYETANFPTTSKAEFPIGTLNDKKLSVFYGSDPDSIFINNDIPLSTNNRDIFAINGVIHQITRVIAPKDVTAASYIQEKLDKQEGPYLACFRVIQACGLLDTLSKVRDEVYETLYQEGKIENLVGMTNYGFAEGNTAYAPKHRLYGFTIFAEPDDYWVSQGIDPHSPTLLSDLTQWILDKHQYSDDDKFVTDTQYDSPNHLLYQWITYHILGMKIPADKLVFHINETGYTQNNPYNYTIPVMEYYTSMGPRRLFKLYESKESNGVYINRFPVIRNGRADDGHEDYCEPDKVGARVGKDSEIAVLNDIMNCNIYPIDAPISYNDEVRNNLQKTRIRFDGMSMMPEAMNNDMRLKKAAAEEYKHVYIPNSVRAYNYFENMQQNSEMNFVYYNAWNDDWCNLYRDEMKGVGRYEITFKLPPVPRRGTYELRYVVLANGNRGVAQIYFGSNPHNLPVAGIPLDLTMRSDNPLTGWERDSEDHDYNAEIDKRMRNNGFMKGSNAIDSNDGTERGYNDRENVRRIIVRQTMDPNETYYLRLKSVLESDRKEFYMDYLEYCPKEVYDNPETPEDIW